MLRNIPFLDEFFVFNHKNLDVNLYFSHADVMSITEKITCFVLTIHFFVHAFSFRSGSVRFVSHSYVANIW